MEGTAGQAFSNEKKEILSFIEYAILNADIYCKRTSHLNVTSVVTKWAGYRKHCRQSATLSFDQSTSCLTSSLV